MKSASLFLCQVFSIVYHQENKNFYSGNFADTAECDGLSPGDSVTFEVEMQATSCANIRDGSFSETFEVFPTGLTETLKITAEVDCACTCDDTVRDILLSTLICSLSCCSDSQHGNTINNTLY